MPHLLDVLTTFHKVIQNRWRDTQKYGYSRIGGRCSFDVQTNCVALQFLYLHRQRHSRLARSKPLPSCSPAVAEARTHPAARALAVVQRSGGQHMVALVTGRGESARGLRTPNHFQALKGWLVAWSSAASTAHTVS
eukprot:scaffold111559_cov36-Tisochrysis_lutea.AAC.2